MSLKPEHMNAIDQLRQEGYAVIVWTPDELGTASARRVEDRSVELGWDVIDALQDGESDE
jgi:hypothetical protein